jgi:hypothetical protein
MNYKLSEILLALEQLAEFDREVLFYSLHKQFFNVGDLLIRLHNTDDNFFGQPPFAVLKKEYKILKVQLTQVHSIVDFMDQFEFVNTGKAKRNLGFINTNFNYIKTNFLEDFLEEKSTLIQTKILEIKSLIDEITSICDEFEGKLKQHKKIAHINLLKEVNNRPSFFDWNDNDENYLAHRDIRAVRPDILDQVVGAIGKYIDWKFPVLYLEPNNSKLIRFLIAGDPFYFVDDRTLPYQKMLETMPPETLNRIHHYNKKSVKEDLEPNSVGICISWQNFPFKKLGEIRKDIELMSYLTAPGGYIVFDYVDANRSSSALAIENKDFTFQWRDRILQFVNENNFNLLHEVNFFGSELILMLCQKKGNLPNINLNNKLGLVLPDSEMLDQRRDHESELKKYYKSITSKLNTDIKNIQSRDQLLNQLETQQAKNSPDITKQKLKTALGHLDAALVDYPNNHPIVLQAILSVSKLTYALGRIKDSHNLIKRANNDVTRYLAPNSSLAVEFAEWIDFLNNN